jgi:hypothetical protein
MMQLHNTVKKSSPQQRSKDMTPCYATYRGVIIAQSGVTTKNKKGMETNKTLKKIIFQYTINGLIK